MVCLKSLLHKKGPYNRGYLTALHFFRGSRETRQPRYKNNKNNKINCKLIFGSRSSYIAAVVFRGCRETLFGAYRSCRMAPQQVKFRLPRRRYLPAIIRSHTNIIIDCGQQSIKSSIHPSVRPSVRPFMLSLRSLLF